MSILIIFLKDFTTIGRSVCFGLSYNVGLTYVQTGYKMQHEHKPGGKPGGKRN
jgi:hypothetical protein